MEKTRTFEDLEVWKASHQFVLYVYKVTENFPKSEMFGITQQFRRASVSIAANIAEGYKKITKADKLRMYNISQGSMEECRYYIILANDLNYINKEEHEEMKELLNKASNLLNVYCLAISNNIPLIR